MILGFGSFRHRLAKAANDNTAIAGLAYAVAGLAMLAAIPCFAFALAGGLFR